MSFFTPDRAPSRYHRRMATLPRIAFACSLALLGCGKDSAPTPGPDGGGGGQVTQVSGHITTPVTWSGTVDIVSAVTIDPGVTVTVAAGTKLEAAAGIAIEGKLDIEGTSASRVTIEPASGGSGWSGFAIASQGALITHYLVGTGGPIDLAQGATATMGGVYPGAALTRR